jgi:hypothetical protein
MTTNPYEFGVGGLRADDAPWTFLPPGAASLAPRVLTENWTTVHTAAARFIGECFAVGAVLGVVTEMARPMRGKRDG